MWVAHWDGRLQQIEIEPEGTASSGANPIAVVRAEHTIGGSGEIRVIAEERDPAERRRHRLAVIHESRVWLHEISEGSGLRELSEHTLPTEVLHAHFGARQTALTVSGKFGVHVLGERETVITRLPATCARWIGTPTLKSRCVFGTPTGIYSWSAQSGVTRALGGLEAPCEQMSFSHDERHFVSIGGGVIRVWDWSARSVVSETAAEGVKWAEFSPTEPVIALVEDDGRMLSMWKFAPEPLEGRGVATPSLSKGSGKRVKEEGKSTTEAPTATRGSVPRRRTRPGSEPRTKREIRSGNEAAAKQELRGTGAESKAEVNNSAEEISAEVVSARLDEETYVGGEAGPNARTLRALDPEAAVSEGARACIDYGMNLAAQMTGQTLNTAVLMGAIGAVGAIRPNENAARWVSTYLWKRGRRERRGVRGIISALGLDERLGIRTVPSKIEPPAEGVSFSPNVIRVAELAREIARKASAGEEVGVRHLVGALLTLEPENDAAVEKLVREKPEQAALKARTTSVREALSAGGYDLGEMRRAFLRALNRFGLEGENLTAWTEILMGQGTEGNGEKAEDSERSGSDAGVKARGGGIARIDSDVIEEGTALRDHLNLRTEVNALAGVMAAKGVEPPISIGLFGDWGSGKSFFMKLLRQRIRSLEEVASAAQEQGESTAYRRDVVQIEFNAWHYMDADLWASLATHIFEALTAELRRRRPERSPEEVRGHLMAKVQTAREELEKAEKARNEANEAEQAASQRLADVEAELEEKKRTLRVVKPIEVLNAALSDPAVKATLEGASKLLKLDRVPESLDKLEGELNELRDAWTRWKGLWKSIGGGDAINRMYVLSALGLVACAGALVGWVVMAPEPMLARLGAIVGGVLTLGSEYAAWLKPKISKIRDGIGALERARDEIIALRDKQFDVKVATLRDEAKAMEERKTEAEKQAAAALEKKKAAERAVEELKTGQKLYQFVETGAERTEYTRRLGVVYRIRRDFEELSRLLIESSGSDETGELFRVDRIILYIDDLDRCPTKRVVEVLQAVHLLLAFKLFVVVVAVDSRWLLHALEEEYSAFGERHRRTGRERQAGETGRSDRSDDVEWRTTPQNYLEKIFHIPYTLRRMGEDGYRKLVEELMPAGGEKEETSAEGGRNGRPDSPERIDRSPDVSEKEEPPRAVGVDEPNAGRVEVLRDPSGGEPASRQNESQPSTGGEEENGGMPSKVVDSRTGRASAEDEKKPEPERAASGTNLPAADTEAEADDRSKSKETGAPDKDPPVLAIQKWELDFMKSLGGFVPTPRAAKRVVNVYRLIKACVSEDELLEFEGTEGAGGGCQAVMLLLAVQNGYPRQAAALMRYLQSAGEMTVREWWELVPRLRPSATGEEGVRMMKRGGAGARAKGSAEWAGAVPGRVRNEVDDEIEASEAADWNRLVDRLEAIRRDGVFTLKDDARFARRAGLVGRFSYQWRDAEFGER